MRETYYIYDNQGNIVNEGEGIVDRIDAINDFQQRYTEEESREYGLTLCRVEEDNDYVYEVLEELTAEDIF